MGYTTYFQGNFTVNIPDTIPEETIQDYYRAFVRNQKKLDPNLSYCQWELIIDTNNKYDLCWDQGEKFYDYVEWLQLFLKDPFFSQFETSGLVYFSGEEVLDTGAIKIENKTVTVYCLQSLLKLAKVI